MVSVVGSILVATQNPVDATDRATNVTSHDWVSQIIDREGPGILRLLWRLLGQEQDVMDAYQDCFCRLAARMGPDNLRNAKAYAYRMATNIAVEMFRQKRRRQAHLPAIAAQHASARASNVEKRGDADRFVALRAAIAELPTHLRNVVVLRDLSRFSYKEVGRTLGIDPATARVYRRHAVVKLADLLDEGEES